MADFGVRAWRENGIEMGGEDHGFTLAGFGGRSGERADDVAGFVDLDGKAGGFEEGFYGLGALRLLKRRSGNFGEADLGFVSGGDVGFERG